jgi:predicted Zn-dependent protease
MGDGLHVCRCSQFSLDPMDTKTIDDLFKEGLERYEAKSPLSEVFPYFLEIIKRQPKNGAALTCISWLYLMEEQPKKAEDFARKAMKANPADAQARVNLVLALLDSGGKGVRDQVELIQQILTVDSDQGEEIARNLAEGTARKGTWKAAQKLQEWLAG